MTINLKFDREHKHTIRYKAVEETAAVETVYLSRLAAAQLMASKHAAGSGFPQAITLDVKAA